MKPLENIELLSCLVLSVIFTALLGGLTAADAACWLVNSGDHTVSLTDITTGGANSTGIGVSGSVFITITGLAKVQTTGEHSDADCAPKNNGRLTAGSVDVTTSGSTSEGVYAKSGTISVGGTYAPPRAVTRRRRVKRERQDKRERRRDGIHKRRPVRRLYVERHSRRRQRHYEC